MRTLVTGASGFVGSVLVDRLRTRCDEVWVLVHDEDVCNISGHRDSPRRDVHVVRGSVLDLACCERAMTESRAGAVFHLAAQALVPNARRDPWATMEANVRGTYNVLEAFRRHSSWDASIVVASSDKAYGELRHGLAAYTEDLPLRGRGPYDVSKSCADLIAQSYADEYGLSVGIVRAGNVYGPGDWDMSRVVPSVALAVASRQNPVLTSDGTPIRDYLYVDDAVAGYLALSDYMAESKGFMGAFNFSGGEPVSVRELAELAIAASGAPDLHPVCLGSRTGEIQRQVLDSTRARDILRWRPRVDLRTGLLMTIDWWSDRGPRYGRG